MEWNIIFMVFLFVTEEGLMEEVEEEVEDIIMVHMDYLVIFLEVHMNGVEDIITVITDHLVTLEDIC